MATPFLGVAVIGSGAAAAAIDSYGNIVELRAPGPASAPLISTPYKRQRAGSVDAGTGVVLRAGAQRESAGRDASANISGIELEPLWQAEELSQRYLPGSNVLETHARVGGAEVRIEDAMAPDESAWGRRISLAPAPTASTSGPAAGRPIALSVSFNFDFGGGSRETSSDRDGFQVTAEDGRWARCQQDSPTRPGIETAQGSVLLTWSASRPIEISLLCRFGSAAQAADQLTDGAEADGVAGEVAQIRQASIADTRRLLEDALSLSGRAPAWAHGLYQRSLLALLALADRRSGAMPAGLRDHWHYIWPRDAGTVALALSKAGIRGRARAIASFLAGLDAEHAARFNEDGSPVSDGRHEQGDSAGWASLARRAAGRIPSRSAPGEWRNRGDYGERSDERGDFLGNAIVAGAPAEEIEAEFRRGNVLVRTARRTGRAQPAEVIDSAVAWAVRPFPRPELYPLVRNSLLKLAETAGPYGIFPATDWRGHDPWTAATASVAWSLAALGERRAAIRLMQSVRDAATPLGTLPERASVASGIARSTTPLAWSHAFTILALRELWPRPGV